MHLQCASFSRLSGCNGGRVGGAARSVFPEVMGEGDGNILVYQ